jgi:tRNA(Ile)-lysidine synthase
VVLDRAAATALAESTTLSDAGVLFVSSVYWRSYPEEVRLRALAATVRTVGGREQAPRLESLSRLDDALGSGANFRGMNLAGCRVVPWRGGWLVYREYAHVAPPEPVPALQPVCWDGRFLVRSNAEASEQMTLRVGAFGELSGSERRAIVEASNPPHLLPRQTWPSLPVLWREGRVVDVPHLGWRSPDFGVNVDVRFRPEHSLCGVGIARRRIERRGS